MQRLVTGLGVLMVAGGLLVSLSPFLLMWRAGGQAVEQLPESTDSQFSEERYGIGPLFDPDMTVARRTYLDTAENDVVDRLSEAGFQPTRTDQHVWYSKECCGQWDAVWVRTEPAGADTDLVVTLYDQDIQSSWPLLVVLGLPFIVGGGLLMRLSSRRFSTGLMPEEPVSQATTTA